LLEPLFFGFFLLLAMAAIIGANSPKRYAINEGGGEFFYGEMSHLKPSGQIPLR